MKLHIYISLLLCCTFLQSQDATNDDIVNLPSIKVEASHLQQTVQETGKHITIIQGKDIPKMPVNSVDELLSYVSGVETQSRYGFGVQTDISMRGSTFSQVLVLIDGMRLNDPLTAHFNHHIPIPLSEIEQIEILRGPAAAIYGPDAVGGVINIVSKTFSQKNKKDALSTTGKVVGGQHNLLSAQAGIFFKKGKFKIGAGILNNQADGETLLNPNYPAVAEDSLFNAYFKVRTATLSLGYDISKEWSIQWRAAYDFRDFSAKYFYTRSTYDESTELVKKSWNQLRIQNIGNKSKTTLDFIFQNTTDDFIFNPLFTPNGHTTQFGQVQLNYYRIINDKFKFNIGGQFDRRDIESNDRGNHTDFHNGLYALVGWTPTPSTHITASLRGDVDANYGFETTPMLNASQIINERLVLRASLGRSIRAADYTERYISSNLEALSPNRNLGNPDLEAETSSNAELGLDYTLEEAGSHKLDASITFFGRNANNLIDYVLTNSNDIPNNSALVPDTTYFFTQNLKEVTTLGTEIELAYHHSFSDNFNLRASIGYTYLQSKNDEEVLSKYISNHAKHRITSNLSLQQKYFNIHLNMLWKERNPDLAEAIGASLEPSYLVVNSQLDINVYQQKAFVTLQVNNLFDVEYANILGSSMPRRWFMAGVRWQFDK